MSSHFGGYAGKEAAKNCQIPAERLGPMALTDDVIRHRCNVKKKNERAATTETNGICYFDVTSARSGSSQRDAKSGVCGATYKKKRL